MKKATQEGLDEFIYIYIEREREREIAGVTQSA
jgi:hypothetical protein